MIAKEYFEATGKRKAFFDFHAANSYIFRYYIAIPALLGFLLAIFSNRQPLSPGKKSLTIILGILSVILVFAKLWRLFVWVAE